MIRFFRCMLFAITLVVVGIGTGCQTLSHRGTDHGLPNALLQHGPMPRELSKVVLSRYVVEPPDILVIEGIHMVPRATYSLRTGDIISIRAQEAVGQTPYRLRHGDILGIEAFETIGDRMRPGDVLLVQVRGAPPGAPIEGPAPIEADGTINLDAIRFVAAGRAPELGLEIDTMYGSVSVAGLTLKETKDAITRHLTILANPVVAVFVLRKAPPRGISSEFVVEADGSVNLDLGVGSQAAAEAAGRGLLGSMRFGSVPVAGKTRDEARRAIEEHVQEALPEPRVTISVLRMARPERVAGAFKVEPEGTVNLDAPINAQTDALYGMSGLMAGEERLLNVVTRYGSVSVAGRTRQQAEELIAQHLQAVLPEPQVAVSVLQMSGLQQIAGQHLVAPDGTVTLGTFGSVSVVGATLAEAKWAIEAHLSHELEDPEIAVDVFAYNSKVYYVVFQGAGTGDTVYRFPVTGNETVLDAMAEIGGFQFVSSTRMWVSRPTPDGDSVQVLPVDWEAITAQAAVATNYQLMPGDRIFIAEDKLIAFDTSLAKLLAPVERVMGFSMLGANTASRFSGRVMQGGGLRGFFGGGGGP